MPNGTHRTYGFTPLPDDSYVAGDNRYFQIDAAVTGRRQVDRQLVRVESLEDDTSSENSSENVRHVEALDRPSARVIKILHSHDVTGGAGSSSDLLRDDAYVLRRPAERDSRLASGDLDGQIVTMTPGGGFPYRVSVTTKSILEPKYTTQAIPVADDEAGFRDVIFAAEIDTELDGESLPAAVRDLLDQTLGNQYTESTPLSGEFKRLLAALGVADVDESLNRKLLWYDRQLYRYGLYISRPG